MCVLKNILVDNLFDMQFVEDLLIVILKKNVHKRGLFVNNGTVFDIFIFWYDCTGRINVYRRVIFNVIV